MDSGITGTLFGQEIFRSVLAAFAFNSHTKIETESHIAVFIFFKII